MFSVVKLRYIEGRIIRRPLKAGSVLKLRANSSCFMGSTCSLNLKDTNIWLGSGSKSRREIMSELGNELGFSFETISADIDEKAIRTHNPEELVLKLAHAKADAIVERMKTNSGELEGLLITCDQVVVHESRILEKPENEQEAREFIAGYGRAPASTVGSVVCTCLRSGRRVETVDIATITFKEIPQQNVDVLVEEGDIFWCAGGLMVEHPLVVPHVVSMEGGLDSVMGLRKESVVKLLSQLCA